MRHDATSAVILKGANDPTVTVTLRDLEASFDEKVISVRLRASGLDASLNRITLTPYDNPRIEAFFAQLAEDYTGWSGTRTWHNNHLVIDADFGTYGHVALTWTLRSSPFTEDRWSAGITIVVEAGEQMAALAADIDCFLNDSAPS